MKNKKTTNETDEMKFQKNKRLINIFLISTIIVSGIALTLAVLLVLSLTGIFNISAIQITSKGTASIESIAFDTPDEVIDQFVLAIKNNDFEKATQLFAIKNLVEGYDFDAYIERLQAFMPYQTMAPQEYPPYFPLNQAYQLNNAANQIKIFTFSFLIPEIDPTMPTYLNEIEDQGIDLIDKLDPSQLSSLEFIRMDLSSPELQRSDQYQETIKKMAEIFGFIDRKEFVVLYEFNDEYYMGGVTLVEYEQGWQIDRLSAPLIGTNVLGAVVPCTEAQYLDLIEQ